MSTDNIGAESIHHFLTTQHDFEYNKFETFKCRVYTTIGIRN